jgi:hypothetical protein
MFFMLMVYVDLKSTEVNRKSLRLRTRTRRWQDGKYKHERAATEFEGDAGSMHGCALNEASMARRSFLGRIARWSAALAVFGLGPEAWMQAVSGRSIMSSAVAAGAPRDMQLHPFPSDDPFNMPLGVNAWYAPTSDPATAFGTGFNETNSAVGGTRAWGGSSLAGTIRKHEVERPDPHIPHALTIALDNRRQAGNAGKGDPSSPLHHISFMFPANKTDSHGFNWRNEDGSSQCVGNGRMGMRIALDPTICTDAWIEANAPKLEVATRGHPAGVPNPWQVALAKALRDYGGIVD